jgi:hypothetical protein
MRQELVDTVWVLFFTQLIWHTIVIGWMMCEKTILKDYSWVGKLNVLVFQWLFFRLAYGERVSIIPKCILPIKPSGSRKYKLRKFSLLFPIVPMTGWWCDYIPNKHVSIKLYKEEKK